MEKTKERIDDAVSKVLTARANLRSAQADARRLLLELVSEKKTISFVPSLLWKNSIEVGVDHALANALDEEGVESISYLTPDMEPRIGSIHSIRLDDSGAVMIRVLDARSEELVEIREDDTWDSDRLLEFVRIFGKE